MMKNLMIYISPTGSFNNPRESVSNKEAGQLAKIQIENSIELGWKPRDIILVTNFEWEYGPIKALVLKNVRFNEKYPKASKIDAVISLFQKKMIKEKKIYWLHDLDAFQLEEITKDELKMDKKDMALTEHDRSNNWNMGSIFFKKGAYEIFKKIKKIMDKENIDDQQSMYRLTLKDKKIRKRIRKLNKTYNFTPFKLNSYYKKAFKPIRVVHFHPLGGIPQLGVESALKFYLGENSVNQPLITKRLARIFKYHRIG